MLGKMRLSFIQPGYSSIIYFPVWGARIRRRRRPPSRDLSPPGGFASMPF